MKYRQPVSLRRQRRSKGHVIMESVFTMFPTFAMILIFADMGMMLYRWSTLQNAVREGARYAITFNLEDDPDGNPLGQDDSIKGVVSSYTLGMVSASDPELHVNYYAPNDVNNPIPAPGGNVPGNLVEVSIEDIDFAWMMPFSGTITDYFYATTPLTISVYASSMLGAMPVGVSSVGR